MTALQPFRNHRSVDNSLHSSLGVTCAEDASRICRRCGLEIVSVFSRVSLVILMFETTISGYLCSKRLSAGWNLNKRNDSLSVSIHWIVRLHRGWVSTLTIGIRSHWLQFAKRFVIQCEGTKLAAAGTE